MPFNASVLQPLKRSFFCGYMWSTLLEDCKPFLAVLVVRTSTRPGIHTSTGGNYNEALNPILFVAVPSATILEHMLLSKDLSEASCLVGFYIYGIGACDIDNVIISDHSTICQLDEN